jgi:hypothetical protein
MPDFDPSSLSAAHDAPPGSERLDGRRIDRAIARGLVFLEGVQLPNGEFPTYATSDPAMVERLVFDPSVFPTALIARSLAGCPGAANLRERACDFLLTEMDADGLWRHWTREHPFFRQLPPDLDDTSCASAALRSSGRTFPDNRRLLLANRDSQGRFLTWISPRVRWTGKRHLAITLRQLRHPLTLWFFFRRTSAKPYDVDAVVNANTLLYLGDFAGREAVTSFLLDIVQHNRETMCDKWYDNPFVIWYFLSNALSGVAPDAAALFIAKIETAEPRSSLDRALAASALSCWGHTPSEKDVAGLLTAQKESGAWPIASFYHGGRARRRGGGFAEPHPDTPHWGSEALTTAIAIEALTAYRKQAN